MLSCSADDDYEEQKSCVSDFAAAVGSGTKGVSPMAKMAQPKINKHFFSIGTPTFSDKMTTVTTIGGSRDVNEIETADLVILSKPIKAVVTSTEAKMVDEVDDIQRSILKDTNKTKKRNKKQRKREKLAKMQKVVSSL